MAAFTTRPSSASPTATSPALARGRTAQPSPMPATSPNGISSACAPAKPTTSAATCRPPIAWISQEVPTATWGSAASTMMPETRVTRPETTTGSTLFRARPMRAVSSRLKPRPPRRRPRR